MDDFLELFRKQAMNIKEQYPSFKKWDDGSAIIMHQNLQEHQLIKEFLYTVNPDIVIRTIDKEFGHIIRNVSKQKSLGSEFIFITIKGPSQELLEKIQDRMITLGYFFSSKYEFGEHNSKLKSVPLEQLSNIILSKTTITLQFEPKYDIRIEPQPFTYHLTPDFNWKKVRTLGLTPKTQSKISKHPERIYLVDKTDENDIEELAIALWENHRNRNIIGNMELLKIDMSKLKDHKFFEDPKFQFGDNGEAIYTYENIPPYAITHIKSILVNPTPEKPGV